MNGLSGGGFSDYFARPRYQDKAVQTYFKKTGYLFFSSNSQDINFSTALHIWTDAYSFSCIHVLLNNQDQDDSQLSIFFVVTVEYADFHVAQVLHLILSNIIKIWTPTGFSLECDGPWVPWCLCVVFKLHHCREFISFPGCFWNKCCGAYYFRLEIFSKKGKKVEKVLIFFGKSVWKTF